MKITKIGHCCLQVDINKNGNDVRILTDPGNFSDGQNSIEYVDAVLITHEHADHMHLPSLQQIMLNNPEVVVYANESTGNILQTEGVEFELFGEGSEIDIKGVSVKTWNTDHADVYDGIEPVLNTVLFIEDTLLYPGDAFWIPEFTVNTLALAVAGPWCKTRDVIEYAKAVNPRICFPVHDGVLHEQNGEPFYRVAQNFIEPAGIEFRDIRNGESLEI